MDFNFNNWKIKRLKLLKTKLTDQNCTQCKDKNYN